MKRVMSLGLSLALAISLAACSGSVSEAVSSASATAEPTAAPEAEAPVTTFRIAGLKGPTTMGMVKLMSDAEAGETHQDYQVTMYGAADEVVPLLVKGDIDLAAIPANLAANLYNQTEGKVQVAAINTLGVLYVVTTGDDVKSVEDLKGKTVYSTGKGTTPEYVLNYILKENGIDPEKDLTVEYKSEATEVAAALQAADEGAIAVLPQPYVTAAQSQIEGLNVALNLTEEWNKVSTDSDLVTGVLVASTEFIEQNEAAFEKFLKDYQASIEWVNSNTADAAELVANYGIVAKAPLAQKALPACNITYVDGAEMKTKLSGYLQVLFDQNPKAVGGAMPGDDFYYGA
ncbi:MAG: PhnD/SsuA/transferrin family substrate-binding protein [Oscillospiraceae bacterium]|nr:PhnD/SsuA/transferrin family substrate-binding protein [Oscillospiraceae bacterium]